MTEMNIVEKVDKPTEWVSRMVTSLKKNGDIRVCIDPQALNKALGPLSQKSDNFW